MRCSNDAATTGTIDDIDKKKDRRRDSSDGRNIRIRRTDRNSNTDDGNNIDGNNIDGNVRHGTGGRRRVRVRERRRQPRQQRSKRMRSVVSLCLLLAILPSAAVSTTTKPPSPLPDLRATPPPQPAPERRVQEPSRDPCDSHRREPKKKTKKNSSDINVKDGESEERPIRTSRGRIRRRGRSGRRGGARHRRLQQQQLLQLRQQEKIGNSHDDNNNNGNNKTNTNDKDGENKNSNGNAFAEERLLEITIVSDVVMACMLLCLVLSEYGCVHICRACWYAVQECFFVSLHFCCLCHRYRPYQLCSLEEICYLVALGFNDRREERERERQEQQQQQQPGALVRPRIPWYEDIDSDFEPDRKDDDDEDDSVSSWEGHHRPGNSDDDEDDGDEDDGDENDDEEEDDEEEDDDPFRLRRSNAAARRMWERGMSNEQRRRLLDQVVPRKTLTKRDIAPSRPPSNDSHPRGDDRDPPSLCRPKRNDDDSGDDGNADHTDSLERGSSASLSVPSSSSSSFRGEGVVVVGCEGEEAGNIIHHKGLENVSQGGWQPTTLTCSICLSGLVEGDEVFTGMSCRHAFHYDCAKEWMSWCWCGSGGTNHPFKFECPNCRADLVTDDIYRWLSGHILRRRRRAKRRMRRLDTNTSTTSGDGTHPLLRDDRIRDSRQSPLEGEPTAPSNVGSDSAAAATATATSTIATSANTATYGSIPDGRESIDR